MACQNVCRLCNRLIISTALNYDSTSNELIIAIPDGTYYNNEKYCIVIAQTILPEPTTLNATVVITIGDGATRYPLVLSNCQQATATNIKARTRYSTVVSTNATSGVFRLLGNVGCSNLNVLASLPVTTTETATTLNLKSGTKNAKVKEVVGNE